MTTSTTHTISPMTQDADPQLDADIAGFQAHSEAIFAPWRAAFQLLLTTDYQPGALVWMFDHYNTGVIVKAAAFPGQWVISTLDADGAASTLTYREGWLRPALSAHVFTWTVGN
jgi:hypothetical protein